MYNYLICRVVLKSFLNSRNIGTEIEMVENEDTRNRNLMIICGPNGAPFEQLCRNVKFTELYLQNNVDVLVWNFRGFGLTSGSASFDNIKSDGEEVINFARQKNLWNKIGVHGLSMGGLAACSLARYKTIIF
jgi:alpha/beta superfamily hydrolase